MRVAIFTNTSWNIFNFRLSLIQYFISNHYEVVIIVPDEKYVESIKIVFREQKVIVINNLKRESVNPGTDIKLIYEIRKILKIEKIDIILTFTIKPNIYTNFAALCTKVKTINTITGLGYSFLKENFISNIVKYLYKISFLRSSIVVFQNDDDKELFVRKRLTSEHKAKVIYGSGIDTNMFRPIKRVNNNIGLSFLFIGRILKDKGIVEFIQASKIILKLNRNISIHIVGGIDTNPSGISLKEIDDMIKHHKQIRYHGHQENIIEWLHNSDVVVLPSYREGLPKVIIEAMAVGKPVIVTNTAGCRDTVIDNENGYLIEVKSANSLAMAMQKMIELKDHEREKMGLKSREIAVKKFDIKIVNESYLKMIQSISFSD